MASTQPTRVPAEEAATHLRQMRGALRRLVGAARVGDPVDEATHLEHAVELHAGEIARSADQLLRLLGELREAAARADVRRSDAEVTDEVRRFEAAREGRRAAREARGPA
jgi:hypothetical protein